MDLPVEDSYNALLQFSEEVIDWSKEQSLDFNEETLYLPYLLSIQNFGALFRFQNKSIVRRYLNTSQRGEMRYYLENKSESWKRISLIFRNYLLTGLGSYLPIVPMSELELAKLVIENNYPIEEIIAYFNDRLHRKPHGFVCRVLLHGISLGNYDGHNIHPPKDKDLSLGLVKLRPIQEQDILPQIKTKLLLENHIIEDAHSVLEWAIKTPPLSLQIDVLQNEVLECVKKFRLVVGGQWTPTKWYVQSLDSPWVSQNRPYHILFEKKYIDKGGVFIIDWVRKKDYERLNDIIEKRLSDNSYLAKRISITLEKWEDAVYKDPVNAVCNCVIGLETIFKKKQREGKLTSLVPKRVSAMFEIVGHSNTGLSSLIDAYKIRNDDLHGEIADVELASEIDSDVFETVRKAMLVWLQTLNKTQSEMKSFIDKLDLSPENATWQGDKPLF